MTDSTLIRITDPSLRPPLEAFISTHTGRAWKIAACTDLADYASHPAALFSDGDYRVFAKFSAAADGLTQFETELDGLHLLASQAGVLTPQVIGILPVQEGHLLVMEAVPQIEPTREYWRQVGQTLARIHRVRGQRFGLERNGYFGPLPQDNTPAASWPEFYAGRRLLPMMRLAVDAGHLPLDLAARIEKIIARLPALCGPEPLPTLLHGDAQKNNFIPSPAGAVVIDPAVYYGHPEMDLAYLDYFAPVPPDVIAAYRDEMPVDPGFAERRELWRLWGNLACVVVEGPPYLDRIVRAIELYA